MLGKSTGKVGKLNKTENLILVWNFVCNWNALSNGTIQNS